MAVLSADGLNQTLTKAEIIKGVRKLATNLSMFTTDFDEGLTLPYGRVQTSIPTLGSGSLKQPDGTYSNTNGTGSTVFVDLDKEFYVQIDISQKDIMVKGFDKAVEFASIQAYKDFQNTIQNEAFSLLVSGSSFPYSVGSGSLLSTFGYNDLVDGWVQLASQGAIDGKPTAILGLKGFGAVKKDTKGMVSGNTSLGVEGGLSDDYYIPGFGNVVPNHRIASTSNLAASGSLLIRGAVVKPQALAVVGRAPEESGPSIAIMNEVIQDPEIGNFRLKVIKDEVSTGKIFVRMNSFFTVKACMPEAAVFLVTTGVGETAG